MRERRRNGRRLSRTGGRGFRRNRNVRKPHPRIERSRNRRQNLRGSHTPRTFQHRRVDIRLPRRRDPGQERLFGSLLQSEVLKIRRTGAGRERGRRWIDYAVFRIFRLKIGEMEDGGRRAGCEGRVGMGGIGR